MKVLRLLVSGDFRKFGGNHITSLEILGGMGGGNWASGSAKRIESPRDLNCIFSKTIHFEKKLHKIISS